MQIDQRQVTSINLQDGRCRDVTLLNDARGYRLNLVSKEEVVTIHLTAQDLQRLRQEIMRTGFSDTPKEMPTWSGMPHLRKDTQHMFSNAFATTCNPADKHGFEWNNTDWLAFN
jgi:hypothetical protein